MELPGARSSSVEAMSWYSRKAGASARDARKSLEIGVDARAGTDRNDETMIKSRLVTLAIPEEIYRSLEALAARSGASPEEAAAEHLIDAIRRECQDPRHEPAEPAPGNLWRPPLSRDSSESGAPARALNREHDTEVSSAAIAEAAASAAEPSQTRDAVPRPAGLGIVWEGPQSGLNSFALVNRNICRSLIARGCELSLVPSNNQQHSRRALPGNQSLDSFFYRSLSRTPVAHVRHQWPPAFSPPAAGHWVLMQPWEFGSLPRSWISSICAAVDEVWAYTRYVRDCYIESGVPPDRVHVVPLGIDPESFHSGVAPFPLKTTKPFKFLFVGGTIHRKGIDVLLDSYAQAFTALDPVCLVIKDMGTNSFYRGQTAQERIHRAQGRSGSPEIEYLAHDLTEVELAGLYTACDCLVQPYRGEGFALPVAEAMCSGLPVIVTEFGAALDFCNDKTAFLIPARIVRFRAKRVGDLETVDSPWLAEPDPEALRDLLRDVVARPARARAIAEAGSAHIRSHYTWDQAAEVVEERLRQLQRLPIRRFTIDPALGTAARPISPRTSRAFSPATKTEARRQRVSLCMIVKNEEGNLPACLATAADLFDEVIVVDTGSTDRTRAVAADAGARVLDFAWVDDFAAARNEALRHATCDWIFWLDADERLDEPNRRALRALFDRLRDENAAYVMKCFCLADPVQKSDTVVDHVRLFRNDPLIRWQYRVHEQILPAVRRQKGQVRWAEVTIHHVGYQDPALRRSKLERDIRLLQKQVADQPDDPFVLFNLGSVCLELERIQEALPILKRSLALSHPGDSIVRKLYALIVQGHRRLDQTSEAHEACRAGLAVYPEDVELLFQESLILRKIGDLAAAEACLTQLLEIRDHDHFASVDPGLRGYKARHNLAVIYQEQGRLADAEAQWRLVTKERPEFTPAWLGLGELFLSQGRLPDLAAIEELISDRGPHDLESSVFRARAALARAQFDAAQHILEHLIARFPQALRPRIVLSHVLLQAGRDQQAAERALREVLALDPLNAEARHNLTVLLSKRSR
jgi:glycosyltransferase involved in cell wall biosynthesis/tetratricopeptide (TPR) repeat protein